MGVQYSVLVDRIKSALNLKTDIELARRLAISAQALSNFKKRGELPADLIVRLAYRTKLSLDYLIFGDDLHKGAELMKKDEISKIHGETLPEDIKSIQETVAPREYGRSDIDPALQAMSDIKDIFASGDPILIPAIQANINAFKRSLQRERQFSQLINENKELRDSMARMQAQLDDLRRQVDRLTAPSTTAEQQEAS